MFWLRPALRDMFWTTRARTPRPVTASRSGGLTAAARSHGCFPITMCSRLGTTTLRSPWVRTAPPPPAPAAARLSLSSPATAQPRRPGRQSRPAGTTFSSRPTTRGFASMYITPEQLRERWCRCGPATAAMPRTGPCSKTHDHRPSDCSADGDWETERRPTYARGILPRAVPCVKS